MADWAFIEHSTGVKRDVKIPGFENIPCTSLCQKIELIDAAARSISRVGSIPR
jgi:hypothetical protein